MGNWGSTKNPRKVECSGPLLIIGRGPTCRWCPRFGVFYLTTKTWRVNDSHFDGQNAHIGTTGSSRWKRSLFLVVWVGEFVLLIQKYVQIQNLNQTISLPAQVWIHVFMSCMGYFQMKQPGRLLCYFDLVSIYSQWVLRPPIQIGSLFNLIVYNALSLKKHIPGLQQ